MKSEIDFLDTISNLVWNDISKQDLIEMIEERKRSLKDNKYQDLGTSFYL